MRNRVEKLPIVRYENGNWNLSEPFDVENRITCSVVGEMCDGAKVWQDESGNQYSRQKIFGKYYFCVI